MNKPKISFRVIGTSGPLSITWFPGPHGDAVEDKNGIGVGFFSKKNELLSVEFDDVTAKKDHQKLEFQQYAVEIHVKNGELSFEVFKLGSKKPKPKVNRRTAAA